MISVLGICLILGFAFMLSKHKGQIFWRGVILGLATQVLFAYLILHTSIGNSIFSGMNDVLLALMEYQRQGAQLVFGPLALAPSAEGSFGFIFAFQVLTSIVFFSALMSVMYHLGIMQLIVKGFAVIMRRIFRTSGAESLSASANIFIGQTEAPLLVRPYMAKMTESELLCIMVGGMATVSGGIMGAFVGILEPYFPSIGGHILSASVMAAPAGLAISKILLPETEEPVTREVSKINTKPQHGNLLEATSVGAETGLHMALNVGTMLIAFMALVAMLNGILGYAGWSLEQIMGVIFSPVAFVIGVPWEECQQVGQLLGAKLAINEIVAYSTLGSILQEDPTALSERSVLISSYALCGFANFMSIGIQIGGLGAIIPERKSEIARLGIRALIGGTLASLMTASVAALLT